MYLEDVGGGVGERGQRTAADEHLRLDRQLLVPHLDRRQLDPHPATNHPSISMKLCTKSMAMAMIDRNARVDTTYMSMRSRRRRRNRSLSSWNTRSRSARPRLPAASFWMSTSSILPPSSFAGAAPPAPAPPPSCWRSAVRMTPRRMRSQVGSFSSAAHRRFSSSSSCPCCDAARPNGSSASACRNDCEIDDPQLMLRRPLADGAAIAASAVAAADAILDSLLSSISRAQLNQLARLLELRQHWKLAREIFSCGLYRDKQRDTATCRISWLAGQAISR